MEVSLRRYAESLCITNDDCPAVSLPIQAIDGIVVSLVRITWSKWMSAYFLTIDVKNHDNEECWLGYRRHFPGEATEDGFVKALTSILEYINTLRFSRYSGRFYAETNNKRDRDEAIGDLENACKMARIELIPSGKCPVCETQTRSKTKCGHLLCKVCQSKLQTPVCPLCRQRIHVDEEDEEYD